MLTLRFNRNILNSVLTAGGDKMVETYVRKEPYTLKMLRAKYDLTQAQAGKKVGVSANVWHNWEKAKTFPNIPQLQKIEEEFNVTYNDIIFLTNNNG